MCVIRSGRRYRLKSCYSIAVELFNHVARVLCSVKPVSLVTVKSVES